MFINECPTPSIGVEAERSQEAEPQDYALV